MDNTSLDADVLIVGAGPVGLFLANECARRGLRWKLIEMKAAQSEHSKALAIMPRTLEIFDMAGIVDPFLKQANRVTSIAMMNATRTLARMKFAPDDTPYPFVAMVPQDVTEHILAEELRRKGGNVEYQVKFLSAQQSDDCVQVSLDCSGVRRELRAAYVVGCDGAHSAIRHLLDVQFRGQAYDASFMLADIETNDILPHDEMQLCPSEFGPLAVFPMSPTRRRLVATTQKTDSNQPTINAVRQVLRERGPPKMEAHSIHWSSYFRVHHRQAVKLRIGRMFMAGDAAHIHSPIGGQGMNTGLHDAWNLAWKLDLAVRNRASPALIDSYDAERTPVIRDVIGMTHRMTNLLGTPSKLAQRIRDLMIPILFRSPFFRRNMIQRLSQLGVSYSGSPIVLGRGKRYFEPALRGGAAICSKFILQLNDAAPKSSREAANKLVDEFTDIVDLQITSRDKTLLIRPDGYLALDTADKSPRAVMTARKLLLAMTRQKLQEPFPERSLSA